MDLHGFVKRLDAPSEFLVPTELAFGDLRAHVLTRADLHDDVAGINDSLDVIRRTRGGTWPAEAVTAEFDYVDLVWHECEFRNHDSFSYVLRDLDGAYLGCRYLYPTGRRTALTDELLVHDVDVSWWVTANAYDAGWYEKVWVALQTWLADRFPFTAPYGSNVLLPS
jgi:hypothetical protein